MLKITTLGRLTFTLNENPLVISRRLAEAMLVYLVCHNQAVSRQQLIDLLWYDSDPKLAGNNFRATLSRLRRQLGDYLHITRDMVQFDHSQPYWLDSAEFEQGHFDLYKGDFLAGFQVKDAPPFEAWVLVEQERLRQVARVGWRDQAERCLTDGDYAKGADYAGQLVSADPYNEAAHRLKMWLHVRNRERNAAIAQFQACVQLLRDELGVELTQTTKNLAKRIESATPDANNLGERIGEFFGRTHQLTTLPAQLIAGKDRLITLTGMGGIGKSRLAHAIGQAVSGRLLHGVYFVSLVALSNGEALQTNLALAIGEALGLALGKQDRPIIALKKHLSEREILLILDNFEQITGANTFVAELLDAAPDIRILVTSRERLRLRAERVVPLTGLDHATAAVELFVSHAKRAVSDFSADSAPLQQIIQAVDGVPLALELTASWIGDVALETLAAQLDERIGALHAAYADMPARHRSIRAVFDYSWSLLSEVEQAVLARLGVFSADFDHIAAHAITNTSQETLNRLTDKSLLQSAPNDRFQLHPLIREFAREKLSDLTVIQTEHAVYYLNLTATQDENLQKSLLDTLGKEWRNVQAAWTFMVGLVDKKMDTRLRGYDGLLAVNSLAAAQQNLFTYVTHRSRHTEGIALFQKAIDVLSDGELKGKLLLSKGRLDIYLSPSYLTVIENSQK